ncbi:superoxide dismutase family protein [Telmatobacter sp. DSM 110680]|uniref:Superoxide dismutase [Cu-Zn] n=1 Tax=Telmatobacter sp. DSM 110680 TaxID=3036704 RepID=A0AAU7DQA2_9BACT
MRFRILLGLAGLALFSAALPSAAATKSAHADIVNAQGTKIGTAKIAAAGKGVKIVVTISQLTPGEHGIHIHTVGKCEGPAFTSAGGHFNPTSAHHGTHNTQDPHPHLGDLMNLTVDQNGKAKATFLAKGVTLGDGSESLFHDGGTSLVIHAKADDLMSDPSGNSGDRIACGVIER